MIWMETDFTMTYFLVHLLEINVDMAMDPETPVCDQYGEEYISSESLNIDIWNLNSCGNSNVQERKELDKSLC